jgi:NADPH2:quinone reductase
MICQKVGEQARLVLREVPEPAMASDQVRIGVAAAGVNFADGLMLAGRYQERLEPPFAPGLEVAGRVLEVGAAVSGPAPGDRVLAVLGSGGFAEQAVAPATDVIPIPDGMSFAVAAGFPVVYGTSHHALTARAHLQAGDVLLVHGAAGGVGLTAVEIGSALGAVVIATAGGAEKLAVASAHGALHVIDSRSEDIKQRVRDITGGRGADVVYDPVGGAVFDASLRCTAMDGRLLVIGFAGGTVTEIPANILLVKNLTVIGYYWGAYRRSHWAVLRQGLIDLIGWQQQGRITPLIVGGFALEQANEALALLRERKAAGKIVLTVDQNL